MSSRDDILKSLKSVPLISHSATQIFSLLQNETRTPQMLAGIIAQDTAMTAEVLKSVNSATYGLRKTVDTAQQAILFLGEKELFMIAVRICSNGIYKKALPFYEKEKGELWEHSLKLALSSRIIARHCEVDIDPEVAFTAGILADVGKTVMGQYLQEKKSECIQAIDDNPEKSFLELEYDLLGIDHCEVGGELLKMWNLPETLQAAATKHHTPRDADDEHKILAYIVHLADTLTMMSGSYNGVDCLSYKLDMSYRDHFKIDGPLLAAIMIDVETEFEKMKNGAGGQK